MSVVFKMVGSGCMGYIGCRQGAGKEGGGGSKQKSFRSH